MAQYSAPQISDLGSLSAMTLQGGSGTFEKSGGGSDVLSTLTGLTGNITVSVNS